MGQGQFEIQNDFSPSYSSARIMSWKSQRTGLELVLINQATPMVNGYFVVVSEIDNDSGAPHTLEHLVFMGSKKYPYKGLLDMIGNKAFSSTNAWTATDQTVFTLESAGWEGFKTILPVYLDHILHPTLTDSACLTEVYHIDGNGEEKGVVFSEMQGVENLSYSLLTLESQKLRFSDKSGYSSETGGVMDALRVLTNQDIRNFHQLRYRPENLCLIIHGSVEADELLDIVSKWDDELEVSSTPFVRPFVDSPRDQPPQKNVQKVIQFPDLDESFGEVQVSWFGPDSLDIINNSALEIFGVYLTLEGAGKLQLALVDIEEPLATDVSYYTDDFITTGINIFLSGVPCEYLEDLESKVMDVLIHESQNIDLSLIKDCIKRQKLKYLLSTESDSSIFADSVIDNFLYAPRDGKLLKKVLQDLNEFDDLNQWDSQKWQDLVKKYFVDNCRVVVLGEPSKDLYQQLKSDNEARLEGYKKEYGEDGLKRLQQKLDNAQEMNNQPIPSEVMDHFKMPNPEKIRFIETKTAKAGPAVGTGVCDEELQAIIDEKSPSEFPLFLHFESFSSEFVCVRVNLSSFVVDCELLPYIEVILSNLYSLPMELENGINLTYDEVARSVANDTVQAQVSSGSGLFGEYVLFSLDTKIEDYGKIIEWVKRGFFNSIFDENRIKVLVEKHLNGLAETKREAQIVMESDITQTTLSKRSLKLASDHLANEEFYRKLQQKIIDGNFGEIKADLEKLRNQLFRVENMRVLVMGDISRIHNPVTAWESLTNKLMIGGQAETSNDLIPISHSSSIRSPKGISLDHDAILTPVAGTESCYLSVVGRCFTSYDDEDFAALCVATWYLHGIEGPLWRAVRGTGLAYGVNFFRRVELGQLVYQVYRGTDAAKAIAVTRQIIEDLVRGVTRFESADIEAGISSIVHSIVSAESTTFSSAMENFYDDVFRARGKSFAKNFIAQISSVTEEDLKRVAVRYLLPLFNPATSIVIAACHPSMVNSLEGYFEQEGYDVTVKNVVGSESDEEDSSDEQGLDEGDQRGEASDNDNEEDEEKEEADGEEEN